MHENFHQTPHTKKKKTITSSSKKCITTFLDNVLTQFQKIVEIFHNLLMYSKKTKRKTNVSAHVRDLAMIVKWIRVLFAGKAHRKKMKPIRMGYHLKTLIKPDEYIHHLFVTHIHHETVFFFWYCCCLSWVCVTTTTLCCFFFLFFITHSQCRKTYAELSDLMAQKISYNHH